MAPDARTAILTLNQSCDAPYGPSRLERPPGHEDGVAADGRGDEPAAGDLGCEADQARPAHLVALLDGERVGAVAQAAGEHAGKGGGGRAGRGIFRDTHAGREHAGMKMVTGLDGLVAERIGRPTGTEGGVELGEDRKSVV